MNELTVKKDKVMRDNILSLEKTMFEISDGTELDSFPLAHYFAPGAYAREMLIPKDHLIVGKIHKHAHLNILSYGKVRVATEEGVKTIEAPCTFISPAGVKRAVTALEDTLWTTIHITEETDLEIIEEEIIAPSFEAFESFEERKKIGAMP